MDHLTRASRSGDAAAVRRILDEDARSELPLIAACTNGYYDVVSLLLSRGFNPNRTTGDGATPLFAALCSFVSVTNSVGSPPGRAERHVVLSAGRVITPCSAGREMLRPTILMAHGLLQVPCAEGAAPWHDRRRGGRHYTLRNVPEALKGGLLCQGPHRLWIGGTAYACFTDGRCGGLVAAFQEDGWADGPGGGLAWGRPGHGTMGTMSHVLSRRISPGETYTSPPNTHRDTVMFVVLVPGSGPDPRIRVVRALLRAGADIYDTVPHFGTALRVVCQTPSPPLKLLVRRFLAHRMRSTARHWWLPWPLACHVAGFLV
jgi:hypothetical protein